MGLPHKELASSVSNINLLLAYVADLELEVDRLRKQSQFVQQEARDALKQIQLLCRDTTPGVGPPPLPDIDQVPRKFAGLLRDMQEPSGYHPAHDQVIAIAVRPLVEQVFR